MGSKIEWTDETWNPVTGCTKVSTGCKHCYAERLFPRVYPGRKFSEVVLHHDRLEQPFHWKKPRRVFVNSMSDLFHQAVPFEFVGAVFDVCSQCPQHIFQVLTKRSDRMLLYTSSGAKANYYASLSNVWFGVSAENQDMFNERVTDFIGGSPIRFVSCEPLLGPICLGQNKQKLKWVIVGGESGPKARPMDPDWARSIRDQCKEASIPFFMKQMAKKAPIPDDLMVREYP